MSRRSSKKGFTILEMLVSVGIMVAISTMIAGNQSRYTSGTSLKNAANDLALSLRQAQVYGIAVKEFSPGTQGFKAGYGVEFNLSDPPLGGSGEYIFFADRDTPPNNLYDSGWSCPATSESECLDKVSLGAGNSIASLCQIDVSGAEGCDVERLDISFVRPAIESKIVFDGVLAGSAYKGAKINLVSNDGKTHSVTVYTTGQISVQ